MLLRVLVDCCRSCQDQALENLALRHQLEVLLRRQPKPRLHNRDRTFWVWLRWLWPEGWSRHLRIVQPQTVIGWHRRGWRLYWNWRSRTRLGRPRLSPEVRELIARISRDNPLWGTERIRGELLMLAIVISNRSIRRYRWRWSQAREKSELENVPAQPDQGHLGGGPIRGPDDRIPNLIRVPLHQTRTQGADALQRYRQPDGCMDLETRSKPPPGAVNRDI